MLSALLCVLMMVAMIWMMVGMPAKQLARRASSEHAREDQPEA